MSKTATLIKEMPKHRNATHFVNQKLYKLSPPISGGYEDKPDCEYVIVSAAMVPHSGPETYVFGSDEAGKIIDWNERAGSYRGGLDHEEALRRAGYSVRA